jgi:hypothetical protein
MLKKLLQGNWFVNSTIGSRLVVVVLVCITKSYVAHLVDSTVTTLSGYQRSGFEVLVVCFAWLLP